MPVFLTALPLTCILACLGREPGRIKRLIFAALLAITVAVVILHLAGYGLLSVNPAAQGVNVGLILVAAVVTWQLTRGGRRDDRSTGLSLAAATANRRLTRENNLTGR